VFQRDYKNSEQPAEEFTNRVIWAHCSSLSENGDKWSTTTSLRHLHMTLVKITADLCRFVVKNQSLIMIYLES